MLHGIPIEGRSVNADGYVPARKESSLCIGLDIGQASDPAAIVLLERRRDGEPIENIDSSYVQKLFRLSTSSAK